MLRWMNIMRPAYVLAAAIDPTRIFLAQNMTPDPWQKKVLESSERNILLNCSRGAGKSRVTSVLALHTALMEPARLVLLISRALRQSVELLRYVKEAFRALDTEIAIAKNSQTQIEFSNRSRIVALPGKEETIRSFQGVNLLILDEAARVPDLLYSSVRPMTGVANGRTVCLSTPFGQRGFFWRAWCDNSGLWDRFQVSWKECPRLTEEFIEQERRQFGDAWVAQEYECDFTACEGLVYPDFENAILWDWTPPTSGKRVGGIDWGFRNPFAAIWGTLDRDDVLWIEGERYKRHTPLHKHAAALPEKVAWYADPSGPTEINELRAAGHTVRAGQNDIRPGIQAITARLITGRLRINGEGCPNLVAESRLYRYPKEQDFTNNQENPVDEHNHALDALRYLISRLDASAMARFTNRKPKEKPYQPTLPGNDLMNNPTLWTPY